MGDYTRLTMWAEVKRPDPAFRVLQHMINGTGEIPDAPAHRLFTLARAPHMLRCASAYHETGQTLFREEHGDIWQLNIDCSFKNYEGELDAFLDWFSTVDATDVYGEMEFAGFSRYEYDVHPTLIYRTGKGQPYKLVHEYGQSE